MKRIYLFILAMLILTCSTWAFILKGQVLSQAGKPVAKAIIIHRASKQKTFSNEKGFFRISIPESKKVTLEIIHPEYIDKTLNLRKEQAKETVIIKLDPYIRQREEVVVTALRYPEASTKVPAAEAVLSMESIQGKMASNIADSILELPGVSNIGSGGFSVVPNIRGLARRRVLILIDGTRVTSDRRAGPSASFVNPKDIDRIEVLRSPSSVFYGSDAIGGVIHILTKRPAKYEGLKGEVSLKYGTINQEKSLGLSLGGSSKENGYHLSFQGIDAGNYSSPSGEVRMSMFSQGSLFGKFTHDSDKREITLSLLGARGYDIGKANQDSMYKPTWYPLEIQNLIQLSWKEKNVIAHGEFNFLVSMNPNSLETIKERINVYKTGESYSKSQSLDYGFHLSYGKNFQKFRINGGVDFFGRSGVKTTDRNTYFDSSGNEVEALEGMAFSSGNRKDLGIFLSVDYFGIRGLDLVSGVRWDQINMSAIPGEALSPKKSQYNAFTGFFGVSAQLSKLAVAFVNISRAYRAPSLSELFYTGITGRGFIISQPNLKSETSLNLDLGIKFMGRRFFIGLYTFYYRIDNLIERYMPSEGIYTYGNIDRGRIGGYEFETEYFPFSGWKLFGNFFLFSGVSLKTDEALNDVPAPRIRLGTKIWIEHFSLEINSTFQLKKEKPGPAEIPIPGYEVFNLRASYQIGSSLRIYSVLSNIFNQAYLPRPDPSAVEAPARNFIMGINFSF